MGACPHTPDGKKLGLIGQIYFKFCQYLVDKIEIYGIIETQQHRKKEKYMATTTPIRVRITDESVANIGVAKKATIEHVKGGYKVKVSNDYGSEYLKDGSGHVIYKTKGAGKKVIERHNPNVEFEDKEILPSASMRPPVQQ